MTKKYKIIYADPPWSYRTWKKRGNGVAEKHYSTMTLGDICELPVDTIADDDCVLFIWTTFPQLQSVFKVIEAWGFSYKTCAFV